MLIDDIPIGNDYYEVNTTYYTKISESDNYTRDDLSPSLIYVTYDYDEAIQKALEIYNKGNEPPRCISIYKSKKFSNHVSEQLETIRQLWTFNEDLVRCYFSF